MMNKERSLYILKQLLDHLPFSIFGVLAALILMGILTFIAETARAQAALPVASAELFHLFHPAHVMLSAVATTAMFWRHDSGSIVKTVMVGLIGSIVVCGLSDILIPFLGGGLLGATMHIHVCLLEEPGLVLPFALIGVCSGFAIARNIEYATQYSHSVHVFLSSAASLLYLLGYGLTGWMHHITGVFLLTIFAVMIPCCLSDIVFPLYCTHKNCQHH